MKVKRDELRRLISSAKRVYVQFWFTKDGGPDGQTHLRLSRDKAMKLADLSSDANEFTVYFHEAGVTAGHLYIESGRAA